MTVYELIKTLDEDSRARLVSAGIIGRSTEKHIAVYELFTDLTGHGMPKMQAYTEISEQYAISEENVRKIIRRLCGETIPVPEKRL